MPTRTALLLMTLLIGACSTNPGQLADMTENNPSIQQLQQQFSVSSYSAIESPQQPAIAAPNTASAKGYHCTGNETNRAPIHSAADIEMSLYDADLRESLNELSILTGVSIISDYTVEGYTSVNIHNATLQEALQTLLAVGNYGYRIFDNYILVGAQGTTDPSYHLLSSTCHYKPVYATAHQIMELLPAYYQQYVNYNNDSASLSIVAPDSIQHRLRNDIQLLDQRPEQVKLELTIVEVSKKAARNLGFDWNQAKQHFANYQPPSAQLPNNAYVLPRTAQRAFLNAIQALAANGQAKIKAMPSIVTLDGKTADFKSLQTQWLADQQHRGNSKLREIQYGVEMTITPHVADHNAIQLDIDKASVSDLTINQQGLPEIIGHSISSSVRVANGQTLVVGGLINNKTYKTQNTVPGIGKLPLIGGLFGHTQSHSSETEVLIVIRPVLTGS